MKKMRDPVVPLRTKVYGEVDAGDCYAAWITEILQEEGWIRTETDAGSIVKRPQAALGLYVDDGMAAGRKEILFPALIRLSKTVKIKEITRLSNFLGTVYSQVVLERGRGIVVHQKEYTRKICEDFERDNGGPVRDSYVPLMEPCPTESAAPFEQGVFITVCRRHIGALLFLARCSRPDISYACGVLAREVAKWTVFSDGRLRRLFGDLRRTATLGLLMRVDAEYDGSGLTVVLYTDADHGGDVETARSTSGWILFLSSRDGKLRIVLEWGSKRQMAVSRSTTEAELVSASTACTTAGLPTLSLVEELTDGEVLYKQVIDNEAARLIVLSSKPGKMAHLRKHQRLTVGFLSDVFKEPGRELERVPTDDNTGDLLTKAMARVRHQALMD